MLNYLGTLIPPVVASNSFCFAISDACICSYSDKSHDIHSNGGENKCAISSFHEWLCIEGRKNYWLLVTVPPLGYDLRKRKQVSVLGLDTCYSIALLEHHSFAKVGKIIVSAIGVEVFFLHKSRSPSCSCLLRVTTGAKRHIFIGRIGEFISLVMLTRTLLLGFVSMYPILSTSQQKGNGSEVFV